MKRIRTKLEPEEYLMRIDKKHREDKAPIGTSIIKKEKQKGVSRAIQSLMKEFNRG